MLKRVVGREDWATKYRASFGGPLVDAYATVLFERGYPRAPIKHILRDGKKFIDWGKARGPPLTAIDDEAVALFDRRNARCAPSHDVRVALPCNARHLVDFLRERDIVPSARRRKHRHWRNLKNGCGCSGARGRLPSRCIRPSCSARCCHACDAAHDHCPLASSDALFCTTPPSTRPNGPSASSTLLEHS